MPTYDEKADDVLCGALGRNGFCGTLRQFANRFGWKRDEYSENLPLKQLAKIVGLHHPNSRSVRTGKVVIVEFTPTQAWRWQGNLVIQRSGIVEPMFEGHNGRISVGNTLFGLCDSASRLVPGIEPVGPPYHRPFFDGDETHLDTMVWELLRVYQRMIDIIRADLAGLPQS